MEGKSNIDINSKVSNANMLNDMQINMQKAGDVAENTKLLNTLNYWNNTYSIFMQDNVVILCGIKNSKVVRIAPVCIFRQLITLDLLQEIQGLNALTNPNFLYIRFNTAMQAAQFQNCSAKIEESDIFYIGLHRDNSEIAITVDAIPPLIVRKHLPEKLKKFGVIKDIVHTDLVLPGGKIIETIPTTLKVQLQKGMTTSDIPYFIMLDNVKVYLSVKGRRNLCYNCEKDCHMSRNCPYSFCRLCKSMELVGHVCKQSYASKLKVTPLNLHDLLKEAAVDQFPPLPIQREKISDGAETNEGLYTQQLAEFEGKEDLALMSQEEYVISREQLFPEVFETHTVQPFGSEIQSGMGLEYEDTPIWQQEKMEEGNNAKDKKKTEEKTRKAEKNGGNPRKKKKENRKANIEKGPKLEDSDSSNMSV